MITKQAGIVRFPAVKPAQRRLIHCNAAITWDFTHVLQQEVTVEGVLHVSSAQAGACLEKYGDIDSLSAPELPSLDKVLADGRNSASNSAGSSSSDSGKRNAASSRATTAKGTRQRPQATGTAQRHPQQQQHAPPMSRVGSVDRVVNEALCLATPEDPTELDEPARQVQPAATRASSSSINRAANKPGSEAPRPTLSRLQLRTATSEPDPSTSTSSSSSSSSVLQEEAEELFQLEGAAFSYQYQYSCSTALYAREALQASAAVRRRRRRALVRMLREGRALTASGVSVLASIGSSISSIGSWEDELIQGLDDSLTAEGDAGASGGRVDVDDVR